MLSGMSVSGKYFKRSVFKMADRDIEGRRALILRKIIRKWNEKEKADNAAVCFEIRSGCMGTRIAGFLRSLWRDKFTNAQYM